MDDCAGAILRLLSASDVPAAVQLSAEAGWNQTSEDWLMLIDLAPEGCLVMQVDNELAATTTLLCYGRRLAWIGMVLTKLQYRGRGLARRLLTQALEQADQMGIETVKLDATEQGKPLYEKLGFRAEQAVERWSRSGSVDTPGILSYEHPSEEWPSADLQAFGADRSQLLERLAHRNPPLSIAGSYLFTRPGRKTAYLGPCVSDTPATARTLIGRALQTAASSGWSWDLLPQNTSAVAIARDLSFVPTRRLLRMVRGKDLYGQEDAIYAIAGFELG